MTEQQRFRCIAVVPPGLEECGAAELRELGATHVTPLRHAVGFQSDLAGFYRLQQRARLPFRLLRQLAVFPCQSRDDLYAGVQDAADWQRWLPLASTRKLCSGGSHCAQSAASCTPQ